MDYMKFEEKQREALPVTIEELEIIVSSLEVNYQRLVRKAGRIARHNDEEKGRSIKETHTLAKIQECLQYVTIVRNIRTNKLNPDVAASGGLTVEKENPSSTGKQECPGS